jgi:hypothetical protein
MFYLSDMTHHCIDWSLASTPFATIALAEILSDGYQSKYIAMSKCITNMNHTVRPIQRCSFMLSNAHDTDMISSFTQSLSCQFRAGFLTDLSTV